MDGNFHLAPPEFAQLYVIRAETGQSAITCIYALLERQNRETYEELLEAVIDRAAAIQALVPNPFVVHLDFEMAVWQALRTAFNGVIIRGCFYHLTQVDQVF